MNGKVKWITGLSGVGKTKVANELCQRFQKLTSPTTKSFVPSIITSVD